jgi:hypothetical protein
MNHPSTYCSYSLLHEEEGVTLTQNIQGLFQGFFRGRECPGRLLGDPPTAGDFISCETIDLDTGLFEPADLGVINP